MRSSTKIAVVTGGTAGIGRATVREFARQGYDVAVIARGRDGLDATVAEVEKEGRRALAVAADVSDAGAMRAAAGRIEDELGPVTVWVNNAFAGSIAFFADVEPDEFRRITEVTYFGQVNGTRAALERMQPRDAGVIVNISSALAYQGIPLQSAYCGAKHAIVGFTESLRAELRHQGRAVQVCLVALPGVNTPQFDQVLRRGIEHQPQPVAPIYQPEVAARAVVHLAEHPRRSMWVGGSTFATILGNRLAPGFMERYLARTNVAGQQNEELDPPSNVTNLWEPVPGDQGAHGEFDDTSHPRSAMLAVSMHRGAAAAAALGAVAAAVAIPRLLRR